MMNKQTCFYIERWHVGGRTVYTLWEAASEKDCADRFWQNPETGQLACTLTEADLRADAKAQALPVIEEAIFVLDFDKACLALNKFRSCQFLFKRQCNLFLNLWNAIDDLSHTLGEDVVEIDVSMKTLSDKLYGKLFYGLGLLGGTPKGCRYSPRIVTEECAFMRYFFRMARVRVLQLIDRALSVSGGVES